jgi:hypothetical protein
MDNPDAPLAGQRNGGSGLGHGVHGRADDRDIELDIMGKGGPDLHLPGKDFRLPGKEQKVIKSQSIHDKPVLKVHKHSFLVSIHISELETYSCPYFGYGWALFKMMDS